MSHPLNSRQHIASLDGWRGIAILLVFMHHYFPRGTYDPLSFMASLGWAGVDLFFVLSGFLITGILFDSREATNRFSAFYSRRALRLFPLYGLAVGVVILATRFLHGVRSWAEVPALIYGTNIARLLPGAVLTFPPNLDVSHFWSLALEEQFYSFWPLIVFLAPRRRTLLKICAGGIVAALLVRLAAAWMGASPWFAYTELPARMDSLLAGGALALGIRGPMNHAWLNPGRLWKTLLMSSLGLALVLFNAKTLFFMSLPMSTFGYTLLAVMATCILALALIPGTIAARIGSVPILRFYGKYSYGLYVWHYLFSPACYRWLESRRFIHPAIVGDLVYFFLLLVMFTLLAALSYELFEKRFLLLKSRFVPDHSQAPGLVVEDR